MKLIKNYLIISLLALLVFGMMAGTASAGVPAFTETIKAKDGSTNKILKSSTHTVPIQPYSILLPSAAIVLPSTTSSHVN